MVIHEDNGKQLIVDGDTVTLRVRKAGRTLSHSAPLMSEIRPVTSPAYLDALRKQGKDPDNHMMFGDMAIHKDHLALLEPLREAARPAHEAKIAAEAETEKRRAENLIGRTELVAAHTAAMDADEKYSRAQRRVMDEYNDGASWPNKPDPALWDKYKELATKYPRAAAHHKYERIHDSTHWADNTGRGAAAKEAMRIIEEGGSLDDAAAAAEKRKEYNWN